MFPVTVLNLAKVTLSHSSSCKEGSETEQCREILAVHATWSLPGKGWQNTSLSFHATVPSELQRWLLVPWRAASSRNIWIKCDNIDLSRVCVRPVLRNW